MDINTVTYDGEAFIVNDSILIMNGQDIEGVEEVRQWLANNNHEVPEYSSVRIEVTE